MLTIEVNEDGDNIHHAYFHSVIVEGEITPDQAETLDYLFEAHKDVTLSLARVRPGDDIYGTSADRYQFHFWASCDLTAYLKLVEADLIAGAPPFDEI